MLEFEGIGTHWWIENLAGDAFDNATSEAVLEYVQTFNAEYSRFKESSFIGILNTKKVLYNPPEKLLEMLRFSQELYEISEGAFDITIGGVLHSQGYGSGEHASSIVPEFWKHCIYNRQEIRIPEAAVIDSGGYGKGWLIDELVELLHGRGYSNIIVNGGGDLRITNDQPVEFALEHPYDNTKKVGSTKIANGALAVSGTAKRQWKHSDITYNHIVDPHSGTSLANDVAATYVQAFTARVADTLATALMVRPDLKEKLSAYYNAKIVVLRDSRVA